MFTQSDYSALIFCLALAATFFAAMLARVNASDDGGEDLAGRHLNRWLVGLSAATTGNSGFIVTGAVGLGYIGGVHWLLLPLSWLAGDLIFWALFPGRLNQWASDSGAVTLPEMIAHDFSGRWARAIVLFSAVMIMVLLAAYASGQWLAAKKIIGGISPLSDTEDIVLFALLVVSYSCIGGFRGSVYTDFVQAFIRIIGTVVALAGVIWIAIHKTDFAANITAAGDTYLSLFSGGWIDSLGFIAGFAAAAVGFGLGQPQIVARYMAGKDPAETRAARWIYIGFVHSTWIAMTVFGIILRGVMPGLDDPEAGLTRFFMQNMGAVATGIIAADIFATIASTANGILIAITQTLRHDLLPVFGKVSWPRSEWISIAVGLLTIALSLVLRGSVATQILSAASLLGAGLGGVVMIRIMGWKSDARSIFWAMTTATAAATLWQWLGYDSALNESAIGLLVALLVNKFIPKNNFSPSPLSGWHGAHGAPDRRRTQ